MVASCSIMRVTRKTIHLGMEKTPTAHGDDWGMVYGIVELPSISIDPRKNYTFLLILSIDEHSLWHCFAMFYPMFFPPRKFSPPRRQQRCDRPVVLVLPGMANSCVAWTVDPLTFWFSWWSDGDFKVISNGVFQTWESLWWYLTLECKLRVCELEWLPSSLCIDPAMTLVMFHSSIVFCPDPWNQLGV